MISGAHKAFNFRKYAAHYLGAFAYRFNHRFSLPALLQALLGHAASGAPTSEHRIGRGAEAHAKSGLSMRTRGRAGQGTSDGLQKRRR
jgi:hypothetical protein